MPEQVVPKCRGTLFIVNMAYVKKIAGEGGVLQMEQALAKKFPQLKLTEIQDKDWVPLDARIAFLELCKFELGWDDKRIIAMGTDAVAHSAIVKFLMNYFLSIRTAINHAPEIWKQNYSSGKMIILENAKGRGRLAIVDFKQSPILCTYLIGFFQGIGTQIARAKNVRVSEEICAHKGGKHCEYMFVWDE